MAAGSIVIDLLMKTGAFETDIKKAEKRWTDFTNSVKKGAAALGLAFSVSKIIELADEYTQMAARVRNATGSLEEYELVQNRLEAAAKTTYRSLSEAQEGYLAFATSMTSLGYSTQNTLDLTDSLSFSFTANATQSDKARAAQDALAKSMAKGKVDANAWISILTATGGIAGQIATSMGITEAEVRKLGVTGKLSLSDLVHGLIEAREANKDLAESMSASFGDGLTNLTTSLTVYLGKLNDAYGVTDALAGVLVSVGENISNIFNIAALAGLGAAIVYLNGLGLSAASAGVAMSRLFAIISSHPFVAIGIAIAGLLIATGEFQNALDALGEIAGDVLGAIRDGWLALAGFVGDAYQFMTKASVQSLTKQAGFFGDFFDDVGSGFVGFLEGTAKVFDLMGILLRTTVDVMTTKLKNFFSWGFNQVNDLLNGLNKFFGIAATKDSAYEDSSWATKWSQQSLMQEQYGLQSYFKGLGPKQGQGSTLAEGGLPQFNHADGQATGGGKGGRASSEQARQLQAYQKALQDVENQLQALANKAMDWDQYGFDNQYTALRLFNQELGDANGQYAQFSHEQIRVLADGFAQIDLKKEALNIQELGRAYQQTFEDMRFEASVLGETAAAMDRLRFARQLDYQVREMSAGMSAQGIEQLYEERDAILANYNEVVKLQDALGQDWQAGVQDGLNDFVQNAGTLRSQFASTTTGLFDTLGNALGNFAAMGKASFKDMASAIFADLAKIALRMAVLNLISSVAGAWGAGAAASAGSTSAVTGSNLGAYGAFDSGGYTGPGDKYEVAGLVHKGEDVWSQADIKRHGGIEKVEALRLRGYAEGGAVGQRVSLSGKASAGHKVEINQVINIESGAQVDADMLVKLKREMIAVSKAVYSQETTRQLMDGGVFQRG